jgi:hypothetical protein
MHSTAGMKAPGVSLLLLSSAGAVWGCHDSGASDAGPPVIVSVEDGYPATGDDGSVGCAIDDEPCPDAGACCSGTCTGGVCGTGATCGLPGTPCTSPDTCCSRECYEGICADDVISTPPAPCSSSAPACGDAGACCAGACLGGSCSVCDTPLGAGACPVCIGNTCCEAVGACFGDPACASFLACVLSCEGDGGTGFACALGACRPDADAVTLPVVQCYASACTGECHGS